MTWTTPFTPTNNTTITSSSYNTNARDNLNFLHDNSWQLISSQVLSVAAGSISFSPAGNFKNLKLLVIARNDTADTYVCLTFNSDNGTNYDALRIQQIFNGGGGSFASGASYVSDSYIQIGVIGTISEGQSLIDIIISGWADTDKHKSIIGEMSPYSYGSTFLEHDLITGWWRNTAAITTIVIFPGANNFAIGSSFYLYGG
jgi:hypothetical protein